MLMNTQLLATCLFQDQGAGLDEWTPAGHGSAWDLLFTLQRLAPWAFGLILIALLVQAFRHRTRFRAVETLDMGAVDRLRRGVAEAETETSGEIGVVVLERSDRYPEAPWVGGAFLVVLGTLAFSHLLVHLTLLPVLGIQLLFGLAIYALSEKIPGLRRRFVSQARASEMAEEQAIQEFHGLRLRETEGRTGVLLFVSLFERQVVVLADEGISDLVAADIWGEVHRTVLAGAKRGELEAGLQGGVKLVGTILKERFPATADGENQVEDHVIVRRE
ncbi:MAG: putative membrane protein [Planctomycetota bacterium]|jgi:putative membrane protein